MKHPVEDKLFIATKAFIIHEGRVLVLRESDKNPNGTNPHSYDLPGGRLESGEDVYMTLSREVKEETGLAVQIGTPFFVGEWWPRVKNEQWHIVGIYFHCSLKGNKDITLNHEHDRADWIDPADYAKVGLIKNVIPAFEAFVAKG